MKSLKRALRVVCVTALVLAVFLFACVQFQQRLLRWRAERLMADMHRIRLYQSTWADAQGLMHRWGEWGHYDGSCTASDCRYQIALTDMSWTWSGWFLRHGGYQVYSWFGGRQTVMCTQFIVQDGRILRTSMSLMTAVVDHRSESGLGSYGLIVSTKSRGSLRGLDRRNSGRVLGRDEQLLDHPNFKEGSPSGCTNCMAVEVTYAARAPQSEIESLTSFDLSCLTRFHQCLTLGELLPGAKEWDLYGYTDLATRKPPSPPPAPQFCNMPPWVLGRDADTVLIVEGVSEPAEMSNDAPDESHEFGLLHEFSKVRIIGQLKGVSEWPTGKVVQASVSPRLYTDSSYDLPLLLKPGKRFIVLPVEQDREHGSLSMRRCDLIEDSPANRNELLKGFALHDSLRGSELDGHWWVPGE
jgi:hypothetical protein